MSKIYEIIKEKMVAKLENAIKEGKKFYWRKPWSGGCPVPMNYVTQKSYRGINLLLLEPDEYITYKQICELQKSNPDIKIKKGCHQHSIYYFNFTDYEDEDTGKTKKLPFIKYYRVFSIADVEGIESHFKGEEVTHTKNEDMLAADEVIKDFCTRDNLRMEVVKGSNRAFYRPSEHMVQIPDKGQFKSIFEYYQVIFHELSHATSKTLKRDIEGSFGSSKYAFEELIADISAQNILAELKIYDDSCFENSVAYCQSWLTKLGSENVGYIVKAANLSTKASDYIMNINYVQNDTDAA
jgi:antirestriction protein ArdC